METYHFSNFPASMSTIHVASFKEVQNAAEIRKQLIRASTMDGEEGEKERAKVDFGFVEGSLLVSRLHLLTAIQTAIISSLSPPDPPTAEPSLKLRSHNLHSEFLLYLAPSNNITESMRKHGISDTTSHLVVVRIGSNDKSSAEVYREIEEVVQGRLESFAKIDNGIEADWTKVDKIYKLGEMNNLKTPDLSQRKIAAVINTVAIKNVAS